MCIRDSKVSTLPGEIVDGTFMSVAALRDFYAAQIDAAKADGLLLSLHLKATMMKVSDPVMFGHAAVSYTHLDVYKRQLSGRAAGRSREVVLGRTGGEHG